MATWPHESSDLSDKEKEAYRIILYWAMLDIRILCQSRGKFSRNPIEWYQQYRRSRLAGSTADWLHNLAQHAASDFESFDADWFWEEYNCLRKEYPACADYRKRFEDELSGIQVGQ